MAQHRGLVPGHLYWADGGGTISQANLDGSSRQAVVSGQDGPAGVAVDAEHLFWTDAAGGTVWVANLDGSDPQRLATGQNSPAGVAVGGGHLFWASSGDGTIWQANLDGTNARAILTGQVSPQGVAADATHVYWANSLDGSIWQANPDGSNPHPFNTVPQSVTVNANGSVNFNGDYGLYELDGTLNGNPFRLATVDFEKGPNGTPTETLWVKGDFNLDGKVTNADLQAMLAALKSQNTVVGGSLVEGYQASHNMSNDEFLAICDINDDGVFNAADIATMEQLLASGIQVGDGIFGGGGSIASVPEPASAVLAAISLGLLWGVAFRRRRA